MQIEFPAAARVADVQQAEVDAAMAASLVDHREERSTAAASIRAAGVPLLLLAADAALVATVE